MSIIGNWAAQDMTSKDNGSDRVAKKLATYKYPFLYILWEPVCAACLQRVEKYRLQSAQPVVNMQACWRRTGEMGGLRDAARR